jgi:benzoyl-CoA reductase/2-hydroxyglutaryl-CoA dehydratase subunit BcrC/BadD/HgdB
VVFDDLAISQRRIFEDVVITEDLLKTQSEIMLRTAPDSEKGSPIKNRAERIIKKAKEKDVEGGIFFIMKFCEPEFFDYPQLKNYLIKEGIKSFLIEYEMTGNLTRQMYNRIQSFLEGIKC